MRFYYISIISIFLLLVIWFIGTGLLAWFGSWLRKRMKHAWVVMVPLFLLLYIGPIAEELLISRNFGQLCKKDAGIFIYKTVEVEGFYDSTGGSFELLRSGKYRWLEGPSRDGKGVSHTALGDDKFTREAISKFDSEAKGKRASALEMLRVEVDDVTEALVFPKKDESWRITKLDQPTARYHYRWPDFNSHVSHKINKNSQEVVDTQTGEVLGGAVRYGRRAPWFVVGLEGIGCPRPGEDQLKRPGLIYKQILLPMGKD